MRLGKKSSSTHALVFLSISFACAAVVVAVIIYHVVAGIQFNRDYAGHLKRAADANSLKLAEQELDTAVKYLDSYGYGTSVGQGKGTIFDHTSILYSTPDEQISFHYDNVTSSLREVREVITKGEAATPLERSNVLMKLRETLLDDGEGGQRVTYPTGLDVYPYNSRLVWTPIFAFAFGVLSFLAAGLLKR